MRAKPVGGAENGSPTERIRTSVFSALYADRNVCGFRDSSVALGAGRRRPFSWRDYRTFVDISAARLVPVTIAGASHLSGGGFDPVGPIFEEFVIANGLADRLRFYRHFKTICPRPTSSSWGTSFMTGILSKSGCC
jgi:hypothetical protein